MMELWKTTPVGTIGKRLEDWANGEQVGLQVFAIGVAEEFLYDLSADGPVLIVNGEEQQHSCLNLTSDETVEKTARKLVEQNRADGLRVTDFAWAAASEGFKQVWKTRAEALLLSLLEEA